MLYGISPVIWLYEMSLQFSIYTETSEPTEIHFFQFHEMFRQSIFSFHFNKVSYRISKLVQLPMLLGIGPVKLLPLTSLSRERKLQHQQNPERTKWNHELLTSTKDQLIDTYQGTMLQSKSCRAIHCEVKIQPRESHTWTHERKKKYSIQ